MNSTRAVAMVRSILLGLLLAGLVDVPAGAQEISGSLQGTVSAEGRPEPQVLATIEGPNLQGIRQTRTDSRGFFQFLVVPPGTYTLRLSRLGLRPVEVGSLVVEIGHTTAVPPVAMIVQPIEMEPVVTAVGGIRVDPVQTAGGGTLSAEDYNSLPVDRDYKSIITILPGANQSYRGDPVNVGGSTGLENQYYIDGVNVTDTMTGGRATSLPYNFVRAVDVKTGGYEAQYGRALGAVVNALTYSGTNDFEADVFAFVQPDALVMEQRLAPAVAEHGALSYDFGARVGGALVRDRLWYSAAVNPRVDEVDKEILGYGFYADRTSAVLFASKLNWQASPSTSLELSVFGDPTTRDVVDPLPPGFSSIENPDVLLHKVESGGVVGSLRATVIPSESFLLQGSIARQWDRYSDLPMPGSGELGVPYFNNVEGTMSGGWSGVQSEEDRGRTNLTLRGTLLRPGHTVIAGVDYEDARVSSHLAKDVVVREDSTTYQRQEERGGGTFHNRSPAAYLQDSWRLTDRLTLSPGLRWSGQYLVGASGRTAQRITDEWQPRVGFSWQLGEEARQRVFGSYGRFYQTLPNNIAVLWYADWVAIYSHYSSDPRQAGAVPHTVFDRSTKEEDWAKQISGLQAENFDEFTLGYESVLGEATKLTARATRRDLRSSFQWGIDPSSDTFWVMGTPGEGDFDFLPPPKREYTALEIAAEGEWRQFRYRTSYVLSRTWGNYSGLYWSDWGIANPGGAFTFFSPEQAENSTGFLPSDRTHVFKLSGAWTSRFGLEAGAFVTFESGAPINDFAYGDYSLVFVAPRGSAGRTPNLWNVDLRLNCPLPIGRGSRTRLQLDLLHVGNPRGATWVDELHYWTLNENGEPGVVNPQYRQSRAYQPPMAARIGIQATF